MTDVAKVLLGQKAVVTGASSGIGRAVALARAGADVLVNYRSDNDAAASVVDDITRCGAVAFSYQGDVSNEDDVRAMFARAIEQFGTVDILVNNAGLQRDASFHELTLSQWSEVIDVNLTGQFLCAREAVREFRRRGVVPLVSRSAGKIIFMSSVHEFIPWAGHVNYAASKGGLALLMKSLAQEVAPLGIRVNSVAPGAIRTSINREAWETSAAYERLMKLVPYGRIGEPEDVARSSVAGLADDADYTVGATLVIDGGMALYPGFAEGG